MTAREQDAGLNLLGTLWMQTSVALVGAVLRLLDVVTLAVLRPSLLPAYGRLVLGRVAESPFPLHTYEKVQAARERRVSLRELVYGETSLWFAVRLLRRAGADRQSRVLDLGAGRGRVLLAARAVGAEARGCDLVESHVAHARRALAGTGAVVEQGDALCADVAWATHIYVAWTCLSDATRTELTAHLASCAPGTRVLTLTTPIENDAFSVDRRGLGLFAWGREEVWLHTRLP